MIRRLAFDKVINLGDTRLLDRRWWRTVEWFAEELEERDLARAYEMYRQQFLLQSVRASEQVAAGLATQAYSLLTAQIEQLFPWLEKAKIDNNRGSIDAMTDTWKTLWGDPQDPETQKKIWATVKMLTPKAVIPPGVF